MYYRLTDTTCKTEDWFDANFTRIKAGVIRSVIKNSGYNDIRELVSCKDDLEWAARDTFSPMWTTCWVGKDQEIDEAGMRAAKTARISVYRVTALSDLGEHDVVLSVDGAGYSFLREHFIPFRMAAAVMALDYTKEAYVGYEDYQIGRVLKLAGELNKELGKEGGAHTDMRSYITGLFR